MGKVYYLIFLKFLVLTDSHFDLYLTLQDIPDQIRIYNHPQHCQVETINGSETEKNKPSKIGYEKIVVIEDKKTAKGTKESVNKRTYETLSFQKHFIYTRRICCFAKPS